MPTPLRVLMVEDSEDDALLLLQELKRGGYAPESRRVDTPDAVRAALAKHPWDLVVSDYRLPGFNALAALKLVQETGKDLPFIIVSGVVSDEDAVAAMRAGAHDYVTKGKLARLIPIIVRELREAEQRRENKQLQQEQALQSQKLEVIGRVASGVVHDFNNLLTAISGNAELGTLALATGHQAAGNLDEIRQAVERATSLTRQLLAFTRRQTLDLSVMDLNELVTDMARMLKRLVGDEIELVSLLSPDLKTTKANTGQCQQVLVNLVVNARDAMPQGGTITIRTANVAPKPDAAGAAPASYVSLSVMDTGTGMSGEVKAHIFERLFTTKEPGKGTGLGLSTCQDIIRQSGGYMEVQSTVGQGTTFTVCLPQTKEPLKHRTPPPANLAMPRGTETVLLAEDEPAVRGMVAATLQAQGYTVLQAGNGEEAIIVVRSHQDQTIHLLLTDVMMPRMNGIELAKQFGALRPGAKILFTSGYTAEPVTFQGMPAGKVPFIQKPFLPSDLARKLREVLDNLGVP
jgi:two-component system cell cycle sensor histidine kinase/response regulator CckA